MKSWVVFVWFVVLVRQKCYQFEHVILIDVSMIPVLMLVPMRINYQQIHCRDQLGTFYVTYIEFLGILSKRGG